MIARLSVIVFLVTVMAHESAEGGRVDSSRRKNEISPSFFNHCVFVSVDFQENAAPEPVTDENLPKAWKRMGFSAADVNAASDFARRVALPNVVKIAELCRALGLPRIFIHWGYLFEDAMDLDPEVRKAMQEEHGMDYSRYSDHIRQT